MATRPKVFVTRILPDVGLEIIKQNCDAEVWPEPLPPPYDLIKQKVATCDGLVSLLTDKIDPGLMDAGPKLKVISNFAVGFNNIDIPGGHAARHLRRQHARRAHGRDGRHGLLPAHRRRSPPRRGASILRLRQVENLGAARAPRPGPRRANARRRGHGPHRLRAGQALPRRLGHEGDLPRCAAK